MVPLVLILELEPLDQDQPMRLVGILCILILQLNKIHQRIQSVFEDTSLLFVLGELVNARVGHQGECVVGCGWFFVGLERCHVFPKSILFLS
jgi:hypothetical protein